MKCTLSSLHTLFIFMFSSYKNDVGYILFDTFVILILSFTYTNLCQFLRLFECIHVLEYSRFPRMVSLVDLIRYTLYNIEDHTTIMNNKCPST